MQRISQLPWIEQGKLKESHKGWLAPLGSWRQQGNQVKISHEIHGGLIKVFWVEYTVTSIRPKSGEQIVRGWMLVGFDQNVRGHDVGWINRTQIGGPDCQGLNVGWTWPDCQRSKCCLNFLFSLSYLLENNYSAHVEFVKCTGPPGKACKRLWEFPSCSYWTVLTALPGCCLTSIHSFPGLPVPIRDKPSPTKTHKYWCVLG